MAAGSSSITTQVVATDLVKTIASRAPLPTLMRPVVMSVRNGRVVTTMVLFDGKECGTREYPIHEGMTEYVINYSAKAHVCGTTLKAYIGSFSFEELVTQFNRTGLGYESAGGLRQGPPMGRANIYEFQSLEAMKGFLEIVMQRANAVSAPLVAGTGTGSGSSASNRVQAAVMDAVSRVPRIAMGLRLGVTNVSANSVSINSFVAKEEKQITVRDGAVCTRLKAGSMQCSYELRMVFGGTAMGVRINPGDTGWMKRKDTFVETAAGLRSAGLDRYIADALTPEAAPKQAGNGCGMYRTYYDLSSVAPKYNYECRPGGTPDR